MLTLGACCVDDPSRTFSCSIKPINDNFVKEALEVTGLSLDTLAKEGLAPEIAMQEFGAWVSSQCTQLEQPVFVGLNAPFDWSFVNYYFHRFTGATRSVLRLWISRRCTWARREALGKTRAPAPWLAG